MSEWQEMDTAPRTGESILAWDGQMTVVRWSRDTNGWRDDFQGYLALTHWRPLPAPPNARANSNARISLRRKRNPHHIVIAPLRQSISP